MTWLLTDRGYELIGVDGSEEMLAAAMEKSGQVEGIPPFPPSVHAPAWIFTARWMPPSAVWTA